MKTSIELSQVQAKALEDYCQIWHLTPDEVIGQALAQFLPKTVKPARRLRQHQAFGYWRDKRQEGVIYQQSLRAEWNS